MSQEIGSFDIAYRPSYFEFGYSIMSGYSGPPEDRTIVWDLSGWDGVAPQYLVVDRPDWLGTAGLIVRPPENWLDDIVYQPFDGRIEQFALSQQVNGSVHVSILTGIPEPPSVLLMLVLCLAALCVFGRWRRWRAATKAVL